MTVQRNMDLRFVVIGAGMSGILASIRLREAGYCNVILLEKAATLGGTWRENRYPGLNCDVPAHAYTYSFAPNAEWSSYLAPGPEIQDYFVDVFDRYKLGEIAHFGQEVDSVTYRDGVWTVATKAGMVCEADVVLAATGVLHHPRMPDIAGMESFAGTIAHSARWDESTPTDGLRIGIVGSGSTGVQIVSELAPRASKVSHFQRSPQWIMPMPNEPYTDEQREAFRRDPALIDAIRYDPQYLANVLRFTEGIIKPDSEEMLAIEAIVLDNLEQNVTDPVLREKLRPDYRAACKRLIYSPDYYQVVQQHDVDIIVEGIERIEPEGIRTRDGVMHELDVIILATGFHADRFIRPTTVTGRGGVSLDEIWSSHATAYNAISLPDFPNFFFLNGPTGPVGNFSLIDVAERQWGYIEQLFDKVATGACAEISVTADAMARYDAARAEAARGTIFASGCSSWYIGKDGVPMTWPWSYGRFAEVMEKPDFGDFEMVGAKQAA